MKTHLPGQLRPNGTHLVKFPAECRSTSAELPKCTLTFPEASDCDVWDWSNNKAMNNGKPVVEWQGKPMFAELAVVNIFRSEGWNAFWSECYGGLVFLDRMPNLPRGSKGAKLKQFGVEIDSDKTDLIKKIRKNCTVPNYSCLDLIAWRNDQIVFVELKHNGRGKFSNRGRKARDELTRPQRRFIDSALHLGSGSGLGIDSFLIAEWQFRPA